jgi:hypothetical protein
MSNKINKIDGTKPVRKMGVFQRLEQWIYDRISFSIYVGKIKIHLDRQNAPIWRFGCTYYPTYRQFELNFGKYLLNFWYRETTNPWWRIG